MSTNENTNTDDVTFDDGSAESLDTFAAELFGDGKAAPDNAKSGDVSDDDDGLIDASDNDTDITEEEEDTHSDDTEDGDVSEDDDTLAQDEDEEAGEAKPKKKNRFQERIDELTAKAREAERERDADREEFRKQLKAMEDKLAGKADEGTEADAQNSTDRTPRGPQKDDKKEDGTPKYPLGEYDPQFMRDTMQYMLDERERTQVERAQQTEQERQAQEARNELQNEWNEKVANAQERYPDFQEKGQSLIETFSDIDQQYGEYLTTTIQELDNGTDVFYYLATNPEEAKSIVDSGAKKATIALARIDARLGGGSRGPKVKPTAAKTPPPANKGSAVSRPAVAVDTDDLDAFSRELFKKK